MFMCEVLKETHLNDPSNGKGFSHLIACLCCTVLPFSTVLSRHQTIPTPPSHHHFNLIPFPSDQLAVVILKPLHLFIQWEM